MRALIQDRSATAVHDVSDGGLLVAITEMAMASGIGAKLDAAPEDVEAHAFWFGEDQARYVMTVKAADADRIMRNIQGASIPVSRLGTTGGDTVAIANERPVTVAALNSAFEGWLPAYMAGKN